MNARLLLQEHAHRLVFSIDPLHPQDVRQIVEEWIRRLRGAQSIDWGTGVPTGGLGILLPAPGTSIAKKKWHGPAILIRPLHQDLFASEENDTENEVDAVLEARTGEGPFLDVVAGLLRQALSQEGATARKIAFKHQRHFEKLLRSSLKELAADPVAHQAYLDNFTRLLELQEELAGAPGWRRCRII